MAVLLLKVDFFDSYALPLKGDIEVQTEDGSNTVEASGIIVIQVQFLGRTGWKQRDSRITRMTG